MAKNIHDGHRQRLKNLFISEGLDSFSDFQVLELLLFFGIPYKDTNEIAHALLRTYGSRSGVLNADYGELCSTPGVGPHAALLLHMAPGVARRYSRDRWKEKTRITSSKAAGIYATTLFIGVEYESFYMICLDSQSRVIMPVLISEGTINEAMIYPRIVVENALRHKTSLVILAHNHPGGSVDPSNADVEMTKKLIKTLEVISVKVMDHIIVAGDAYASLAEKRMM
jgi:DNA repair protein RadC